MSEGEDHILSHLAYKKLYNKRSLAMAPHSSTLAWKIPWMEEPGRLQSIRSLRVRHDWVTSLSLSCIGGGNGNPLQYSCLENPREGGAWWAAVYGVAQSRTWLKRLSSSRSKQTWNYCVLFFFSLQKRCILTTQLMLYFITKKMYQKTRCKGR